MDSYYLKLSESLKVDTVRFYKNLGKVLRTRRKVARVSAENMSSVLGVTYQQVIKYETAKNRIPVEYLVVYMSMFNITFEDILNYE